jgi:RHH-type rel operon transcriptional repressor/antitoxin RelB
MDISIQLSSDMENRLTRLVQAAGHDPAFYVLEALREHLDDIEDAYLAASIAEEVRAGRMRTHSIGETRRALGLDD